MTPQQKMLVKESWAKVVPIKEQAAGLFYGRLFETYPEVRPYFTGDMKEQGRKLMIMLNTAVAGLDNLPALLEPLKALGKRHAGYGIKEADYAKVADAFLWTLGQGLGDGFTAEVKEAWVVTYTTVAEVMMSGAAESDAA